MPVLVTFPFMISQSGKLRTLKATHRQRNTYIFRFCTTSLAAVAAVAVTTTGLLSGQMDMSSVCLKTKSTRTKPLIKKSNNNNNGNVDDDDDGKGDTDDI